MRLGRILAIGFVALIALLFIANEFMVWSVNSRFQRQVATIRAAGDPASLEELAPKAIPETENAAEVLVAIRPRLTQFSQEYGKFFNTPVGKGFEARINQGLPATSKQNAAIKKILDTYPDIEAALAVAAASNRYASVADFTVGPQKFLNDTLNGGIRDIRTAAGLLEWRIQVLSAEGRQEEAAKLGIELLKLARLWDNEPLLTNALVGIVVRGIAIRSTYDALVAGPVSAATHAALDQELALGDDPQRSVRVLKTERAFSISMIDEMDAAPANANTASSIMYRMFGWVMQRHYVGVLDYDDEMLPMASKPWADVHGQLTQRNGQATARFGPFVQMAAPAVQSLFDAEARNIALVRALRIFNAMTKFRADDGHEAAGLDELKLPAGAITDPFSGQPLKTRLTKEGWIIYSVMLNGVDDGGDFIEMKDFGVAPLQHRMTEKPEGDGSELESSVKDEKDEKSQ